MCYKSRGPTVISYWSKNESCVLYRSYPGQLRSFKRPGYLEVRREKSRFFLATNLGWRSANETIIPLKFKYVHASNYEDPRRNSDENEEFLSESSNREEAGLFQFKSRNGKSNCTFDSLNTIDSRKSVPFAALPDTTRASTSSPRGDKEDLHSIFSDEVTTRNASCKNSRVLFTDEVPTEGMEKDGVFNENSAEGF